MSVAGVVLAAGASSRFGESMAEARDQSLPKLKQLLPFGGESLVRRITLSAAASHLATVLVVVGREADAVHGQIADLPVQIVENPEWEDGQSTSVRAGLAAVDPAFDGVIFLPCDQPFVTADTINRLIAARKERRTSILAPAYDGDFGAPVLIGNELFDLMATIEGDAGGRQLFEMHTDSFELVEIEDDRTLKDIDTFEDYLDLLERL